MGNNVVTDRSAAAWFENGSLLKKSYGFLNLGRYISGTICADEEKLTLTLT